jgi:hypothetical protein
MGPIKELRRDPTRGGLIPSPLLLHRWRCYAGPSTLAFVNPAVESVCMFPHNLIYFFFGRGRVYVYIYAVSNKLA